MNVQQNEYKFDHDEKAVYRYCSQQQSYTYYCHYDTAGINVAMTYQEASQVLTTALTNAFATIKFS